MARRTGMVPKSVIAALALLGAVSATAPAEAREDGAPPSALGMGDAVRASSTGTSALYFNPAGMGLARQYQFEAYYGWQQPRDGHTLGAAAVDSRTNAGLAMGVGYAFINSELGGGDRDGHRIRGALATGHRWQNFGFHVGVGVHYLKLDREIAVGDAEFLTLDAGLILEIAGAFRLGVVGQNLIDTKAMGEAPRTVGLGASAVFDTIELTFDTELDVQSDPDEVQVTYRFGGQAMLGQAVVARAGFVLDRPTDAKTVTAGIGYVSKVLAADASMGKRVDAQDGWLVSVGFRYFLP